MDVWQEIGSERAGLVTALEALPDDAWDRPSLCAGWTVRDVVAHMVSTAELTPPSFFGKFLASGFNFPKMAAGEVNRVKAAAPTPDALVSRLRARVSTRNSPPGPTVSWLGETIVHGEDVFRALGGYREHPAERLVAIANSYKASNLLIGAKDRIEGVTLRATDTAWSHGSGPEAAGPMVAVVMAMTGRAAALDDLSGDGVAVLRSRV